MALVDYSSSSPGTSDADADADDDPPARNRGRHHVLPPAMPPLPPAFHDLYASSVRQSVVDDASLHHGRTRQTPHVPGRWPTHVYIEWHPTAAQHRTLAALVGLVAARLAPAHVALHSLLASDLGAPLPLHVSLSRPLALPTADKDAFVDRLAQSLRRARTRPFVLRPTDLAWWLSPDSPRAFLMLRVASRPAPSPNPGLAALLTRCNAVAALFAQPPLYQEAADTAFHVSVAWALPLPPDQASPSLRGLLARKQFRPLLSWDIDVSAVKAKVGNVVNHIALSGSPPPEA